MSNFAVDSFAMPAVSASGVKHEEGVFWLLDSGSSYHVISRETLDCGHVKVLSRRQKPRTVCQTATGDLVEVGSDMHATVEVSFLTTHPISANGGHRQDVLSNYACTCRLEAVVSDQIKHNLINLNLLCWKGWKPTLHKGLLTAEQQGVVLLPHLYGPEHPSALYAGELMSSVVGQSVGRSVAGLVGRPEKRVSFQSDSDVPKEEEVFPESFQDLQPQHVFGRHVHDHDVLADYVEHVVDLRLVGQVGSQLASMSELQEQTMLARQSVSSDEERCAVGQGSLLTGQSVVFTKEPPTKEHLGCTEDPQHACPVASGTPQRFSLHHDSAEHLPGPTVQAFASVGPAVSSPVNPVPAVEHVGCERGLLVGQSGGWLELDSGTLCSRQNKVLLPMGNSSLEPVEAVDMEPTQTGAREAEPTADSAGSAGRPGLEPPRVDPPIRRRKRKKGPCREASAAKAKATSAEAAAEAPLTPPTVEEAAAKAPAPPPPALALLPPEVPMLGVDAEEVPPQEESEDESQITGVRGGCNDHIAPGPHSPAGGPHGVAGTILHPHGGRPRDEASEARILVQMQSLPEVVRRCPPAGPDAQHEHAGLHAGREPPLQGSLYRGICRPGPS